MAALTLTAALPAQQVLRGLVRWPDRSFAEGVTVHARWCAHQDLPGGIGWSYPDAVGTGQAITDADGRFRIEMVDRNVAEVWAVSADGRHASRLHFPVTTGGLVELELENATSIGGQVVDETGAPQVGLWMRIEPHASTWSRYAVYGRPLQRAEVRADGDGRFALPWPDGYLRLPQLEPFLVLEPAEATQRFRGVQMVRPTELSRALRLVVEAMPEVHGRVLDAAGRSVVGAKVAPRHQPWRSVPTDIGGAFSLRTDAHPEVGLLASADGLAPRAALRPEQVGPRDVTLRLGAAARWRARLVDDTGAPMANYDVLWSTAQMGGPPREWTARTDDDGVVFCDAVGDASPTFGFVFLLGTMRRFAVLRASEDGDLGDVVPVRRTLRGQALDPDGVPLAGVRVVVRPVADEALGEFANLWVTYTGSGGSFDFRMLPAGELRVMLEAGARGFVSTRVADRPDVEQPPLVLQPSAEGVVELDAVNERGDPEPHAWVMLAWLGGDESATLAPSPRPDGAAVCAFADERGHVRFTGLPDGSWRVQVQSRRDGQLRAGTVQCTTGEPPVAVRLRVMPL